jgi:hypothetical protein
VYLSLTQLANTLCLPYYACVFSSTKLKISAEQVLPGSEGGLGAEGGGWWRGRNDPKMYAPVNKLIKKRLQGTLKSLICIIHGHMHLRATFILLA